MKARDAIDQGPSSQSPARPSPTMTLAGRIGQRVLTACRAVAGFTGMAVAIILQALRPLTWRRTVRHEFVHQCFRIGNRTLFFTLFVATLVGVGLVFQSFYWLERFGQSDIVGGFLNLVLGREIAPLLVGLILMGRSGTVMLVELADQRIGGQVRMLDGQGIDPLLCLVLPRVLATAACSFSLTILFLATAFAAGFVPGNALGLTTLNILNFLDLILMAMGPIEFVVIPIKALSMGFVVGLVSCATALSDGEAFDSVEALIPICFARSLVGILSISALLTLVTL